MGEGLDQVDQLAVGHGYALLEGEASGAGVGVKGEVGWHPAAGLDLFAEGEASTDTSWSVMGGVRYRW